ncbi:MAG TPA: hypothetical protein VFU88_04655 [Ktedonobacterales bacterium]|nr:hypothetical protein [Ktedonobacterales bacterium]
MGRYIGALITVIVLVGIGLGAINFLGAAANLPPTIHAASQGASGSYQHVSLTLQTYPFDPYQDNAFINSHVKGQTLNREPYPQQMGDNADWVKYWPTTDFVVPQHAIVTVTLQNYDGVTPLLNPYYAIPRGITDDTGASTSNITVDGKPETSVDPAIVSHTFTIHSIPQTGQDWLFVSVPVTGVPDDAPADDAGMPTQPIVTVFSFVTPDRPGQYIWQCFDPCGSGFNGFGGPMSTKGYMSGTLTVE